VLIISEGSIVADGTPDELQTSFEGKTKISVQIKGNIDTLDEKLLRLEGIERIVNSKPLGSDILEIDLEAVKDIDIDPRESIFNLCVENKSILMEMKREQTSLEDIFRKLTRKDM